MRLAANATSLVVFFIFVAAAATFGARFEPGGWYEQLVKAPWTPPNWVFAPVEKQNDGWRWAMLCFGECRLMVDESINHPPGLPRLCVLYLYPDDIAEYHRQIRGNGLAVPDLEVSFYGMTEFRIEDPDGNRLWIGQVTPPAAAPRS